MYEKNTEKDLRTEGAVHRRHIDELAKESVPRIGTSWIFVARTRIRTSYGLFLLAFVSGSFLSFVWGASLQIQNFSKASGSAFFSLHPSLANVSQGETFDMNVILKIDGSNVSIARAVVLYNPSDFQLVDWNPGTSVFKNGTTCASQKERCQTFRNDSVNGKISVTFASPFPDVSVYPGLMGTLTFQSLRQVFPTEKNITFAFSKHDMEGSFVVESGTTRSNILKGTMGARVSVGVPPCLLFEYSDWGKCQSDAVRYRSVVSSVPANCSGGAVLVTEEACVYESPNY